MRCFAAADALTAYLGTEKAPETLQAFTRVENITKKSRVEAPISETLLKEDAEKALFEAVKKLLKPYMEGFFPVILPASLPPATAFLHPSTVSLMTSWSWIRMRP